MNYARTLTVLFVWLTYCNAFPLLMYMLWVYWTWQYWMEKYCILRHYKLPNKIDTVMHCRIIEILPYSLLIHWISSWWMYGSPGILDNCWYNSDQAAFSRDSFETRLKSRYGLPFLFFASCISLFLLFKNTIMRWHQDIQELLKGTEVESLGIARNFNLDKEIMQQTGMLWSKPKLIPIYPEI